MLVGLSGVSVSGLAPGGARAARLVTETAAGSVRGVEDRGVRVFRGLRYGASTASVNRFLPPKKPEPWAGVKDCLSWGASAPQGASFSQASFYAWYNAIRPTSEDCLFLNVFTPGLGGHARRPVLVWLHGGGWGSCAGTAPGFDGADLARAQDVVVVTVNHRLGVFGYLRLDHADPRFADAGNAGILDLASALSWVRENIAAFGGDPANVTIFGQSGGAAKVMALMGLPAAEGLFHKAIVQSCSGGMRISGAEEADIQAHTLARFLSLAQSTGPDLQSVPMDVLIAAAGRVENPFRPVIDGRSFRQDPFYPAAPSPASRVPLLIGNADTESSYFLRLAPESYSVDLRSVSLRLQRFLHTDSEYADALIEAYRSHNPAFNPYEILLAITTDQMFKRGTLKAATLQASAANVSVYAYNFARQTPVDAGRLHSPHTSEVPFIFGTTGVAAGICGTGGDLKRTTELMQATWAAFARHGDPNNPALPTWAPFDPKTRQTMVLNMESKLVSDPGGDARAALDRFAYYEYSTSPTTFFLG